MQLPFAHSKTSEPEAFGFLVVLGNTVAVFVLFAGEAAVHHEADDDMEWVAKFAL